MCKHHKNYPEGPDETGAQPRHELSWSARVDGNAIAPTSSSHVTSSFVSRISSFELTGEGTSPNVVRCVTAQSVSLCGLAHLVICRRNNHHEETHLRQLLFVAIVLESDPQIHKPALLRRTRYDLALCVDGCCTLGTTRSPSVVVETRLTR